MCAQERKRGEGSGSEREATMDALWPSAMIIQAARPAQRQMVHRLARLATLAVCERVRTCAPHSFAASASLQAHIADPASASSPGALRSAYTVHSNTTLDRLQLLRFASGCSAAISCGFSGLFRSFARCLSRPPSSTQRYIKMWLYSLFASLIVLLATNSVDGYVEVSLSRRRRIFETEC